MWTSSGTGTAAIESGALVLSPTGGEILLLADAGHANGTIKATLTNAGRAELVMRYADVSNYLFLDGSAAEPFTWRLRQRVANVNTGIATLGVLAAGTR